MFEIKKINKTFKIIIKSGTLSLAARPVVLFWGVKKDWTRAATMLDETPVYKWISKKEENNIILIIEKKY